MNKSSEGYYEPIDDLFIKESNLMQEESKVIQEDPEDEEFDDFQIYTGELYVIKEVCCQTENTEKDTIESERGIYDANNRLDIQGFNKTKYNYQTFEQFPELSSYQYQDPTKKHVFTIDFDHEKSASMKSKKRKVKFHRKAKTEQYKSRQSFIYQMYKNSYEVSSDEDEEHEIEPIQSASFKSIRTFSLWLVKLCSKASSRSMMIFVLPVLFVALWAMIPLNINVSSSGKINFWSFLFGFFGIYMAVLSLLITMIFQTYSINWWPEKVGFIMSHLVIFVTSLLLGIIAYYAGIAKYTLTWTFIATVAMLVPLAVSFYIVTSKRKSVYRNTYFTEEEIDFEPLIGNAQVKLVVSDSMWMPTSYNQFLWFCLSLLTIYIAYWIGEAISYHCLTSNVTSSWYYPLFANGFMISIFGLDFISRQIIMQKIGWRPLQDIFCVYFGFFSLTFYRTLFAKLDSVLQFIEMQFLTSLLLYTYYALSTTRGTYRFFVRVFGMDRTYAQHLRYMGRVFYIRNITENISIMMFLSWLFIFEFGSNGSVYPYFDSKKSVFLLVLVSTIGIWIVERVLAFAMKTVFKRMFNHDFTSEVIKDFKKYPELLLTVLLILIHVGQDMLLALINLDFE
jgi:putative effector of murein hydrolase LrgA (UPF0299 family)